MAENRRLQSFETEHLQDRTESLHGLFLLIFLIPLRSKSTGTSKKGLLTPGPICHDSTLGARGATRLS
jgi:hypothetical protein